MKSKADKKEDEKKGKTLNAFKTVISKLDPLSMLTGGKIKNPILQKIAPADGTSMKKFKAHLMYKDCKEVKAKTMKEHLKLKKKGYSHKKSKNCKK